MRYTIWEGRATLSSTRNQALSHPTILISLLSVRKCSPCAALFYGRYVSLAEFL